MKREIKFRVWDKEYKLFSYNNPHISLDLMGHVYNLQNGEGDSCYEVNQFTGLHDKNGKEIYEGDITDRGIVEYKNGSFKLFQDNPFPCYGSLGDWDGECEIIGNLYENPDLINK